MKLGCSGRLMSEFYRKLGCFIGKHPGYFVVFPVLLTGLLTTGVRKFHYEQDPEYLYTPIVGEAWDARNRVEKLFHMDLSSEFDPGRTTRIGRIGWVILVARDGGTMLRQPILKEMFQVDKAIQNIEIEHDGKTYKYRHLCAKNNKRCFLNDILVVGKRMRALERRTRRLRYPVDMNPLTYNFTFYAANLGGVTFDKEGYVYSVKAIRLMYFLDYSTDDKEKKAMLWENAFLDRVVAMNFDNITLARYVSLSLQQELNRTVVSLLPMYCVAAVILIVFSALSCVTSDWVRSKPYAGILGLLSSVLGVISGFGLLMYCGVSCIDINIAVPFLMAGIGMDDTFVMLAAWRRTELKKSVEERLAEAYSEAAVSITVTSLTNFLSFLIGISTPFPCVRIFCLYAAMSVLFTYLYQITFFGGTMAISGVTEQKQFHSVICIPIGKNKPEGRSAFYKFFCVPVQNYSSVESKHEHAVMVFFRDTFGKYLSYSSVKAFVIFIFIANLCVSLWGCSQLEEGIEFRRLFPMDSYAADFFDSYNRYFGYYRERVQMVIHAPVDYSNSSVQENIESTLQKFEANRFMCNSNLTESWLRLYLKFINDDRSSIFLHRYDMKTKDGFMRALREVFLNIPEAHRLRSDIVFNNNGTEILASRFFLLTNHTPTANDQINMLLDLRKLSSQAPFSLFVQHYMFIFIDQFLMVGKTTFQSITVASAVMMVVFLFFIPSISCSIWTAFTIISIEIGVIGYMTMWNVNLDTISMISLIMCIGFSVDYAAHVSYSFITSPEVTGNGKMRDSLFAVGMPIIQCGVSTILGICVLMFSPSYVFFTFFKVVVLVIVLAMAHSILLLPILLSLSHDCWRNRRTTKQLKVEDVHLSVISPHKEQIATPTPEIEGLISKKPETIMNGKYVTSDLDVS